MNPNFYTDVVIKINLSSLYAGITEGAYEVICKGLHYYNICDGVSLVKVSGSQKELLITSGNECEKIYREQDEYGRGKLVIIKC